MLGSEFGMLANPRPKEDPCERQLPGVWGDHSYGFLTSHRGGGRWVE